MLDVSKLSACLRCRARAAPLLLLLLLLVLLLLVTLVESTFSEVRVCRRFSGGCELCNECGREGEEMVVMGG